MNAYSKKWIFLVCTLVTNCVVNILYAYFKDEPIFNRLISCENLVYIITTFISYIIFIIIDRRKYF